MDTFKFRPLEPDFVADPHPTYDYMRANHPFYKSTKSIYVLTNYDHIVKTLKDPNASADVFEHLNDDALAYYKHIVDIRKTLPRVEKYKAFLRMDDPRHSQIRRMVQPFFSAARIKELIPLIESKVEEYLSDIVPGESFDFYEKVAYKLPVDIAAHMLNIPDHMKSDMIRWGDTTSMFLEPLNNDYVIDNIFIAALEMIAGVNQLIDERRENLGDDLISHLIQSPIEGEPLDIGELITSVVLLFTAGFETTVFFLTDALHALLKNPDQLDLFRSFVAESNDVYQDGRINNAIEELIRFDGSVRTTTRVNKVPFVYDIYGQARIIPQGSIINCIFDAANRDPKVFISPHTLNLLRPNANKNLGFGDGIHSCLGSHLGKIETIAAFSTIMKKYGSLTLTGEANYRTRMSFRGIDYLPVAFQ